LTYINGIGASFYVPTTKVLNNARPPLPAAVVVREAEEDWGG
jgi:hypothetical protein